MKKKVKNEKWKMKNEKSEARNKLINKEEKR